MTQDEYVRAVLAKYQVVTGPSSPAVQAANAVAPTIRQWAGQQLLDLKASGSYAKGTAVLGKTDIDLFISLAPNTQESLQDLYQKLLRWMLDKGYKPRQQNVSIGVVHNGINIDLVPAKKQAGNTTDHSLWRSKAGTWTQTNVDKHITTILSSGRIEEIKALKIWRQVRDLEFPSFYLELTVIEALKGKHVGQIGANVLAVLEYLSGPFNAARVVDPANTNNIVSDDLTVAERNAIASQAKASRGQQTWEKIIW